jgi:hypothetical protein
MWPLGLLFFEVTSDFRIGSVGVEFYVFFQIFFKYRMCLRYRNWKVKLFFMRKSRPQGTMKAFTAFSLGLFTHSDRNCPQSKKGLSNCLQEGKKYSGSVDIFRVSRVTVKKRIFFFGPTFFFTFVIEILVYDCKVYCRLNCIWNVKSECWEIERKYTSVMHRSSSTRIKRILGNGVHFTDLIRDWLFRVLRPAQEFLTYIGVVTIAGEGLQNFGLCSALRVFEQGGIFIVPHLMWHETLVLHFRLLLQNHCANFNQSWHKSSLGGGDYKLFKWRGLFLSKGR